jgi:hypothetical protein
MRSTWTDERIDDLKDRDDWAIRRMDQRMAEADARFEASQRRLDQLFVAFVGIQVTGFVAVLGLVAVRG